MVQKRLYIGGLYEGVKDVDLWQRFSSYGAISGIDIKVKKDSEGIPVKTFAYLNIDATDSDLQKCFRAYNKTRWKGSELSLQFAKDSFIKRLEEERQEKGETLTDNSPSKQRSSLDGVLTDSPRDRTLAVKGAKPGTPVPGQKDWVVAKYGRVEPIVNVRSNDRKKLMKIDPSKYTHNVKKLKDDQSGDIEGVSPEKLTWQLEDNDSEIVKRRKGDFPSWKSDKRKLESDTKFPHTASDKQKTTLDSLFPNYDNDMEIVPISNTVIGISNKSPIPSLKRKSVGKGTASSPSKVDKSIGKKSRTSLSEPKSKTSDDGYDTGGTDDTDEIIAVTKKNKRELDSKKAVIQNEPKLPVNSLQERLVALAQPVTAQRSNHVASPVRGHSETSLSDKQQTDFKKHISKVQPSKIEDPLLMPFRGTKFLDDNTGAGELKSHKATATTANDIKSDSGGGSDSSDSDFESLIKKTMSNRQQQTQEPFKSKNLLKTGVTHQTKDDSNDISEDNSDDTDNILLSSKSPRELKSSKAAARAKPTFTKFSKNFDEFSSGLMPENESVNDVYKVGSSHDTSDDESDFETLVKRELSKNKAKSKLQENKTKRKSDLVKESGDQKQSPKELKSRNLTVKSLHIDKLASNSKSGSPVKAVESKDSNKDVGNKLLALSRTAVPEKPSGKDTSVDIDMKRQEIVRQRQKDYKAQKNVIQKAIENLDDGARPKKKLLALSETAVHEKPPGKDTSVDIDKKRQETVRQRQKDYKAQKNVIQKALANLDAGARPNKKIVFADSDEDSGSSDNEGSSLTIHTDKQTEIEEIVSPEKAVKKKSSAGLFEESSGDSEDEDRDRFKLRPEFEGSAGKKLMKLQSRYGNDERFKLDAKFAESDSEQEETVVNEEDEKTRQLKILASVLGTTAGIVTDKQDKKKKTFKDVSQLQFDPTKDDHSQFEIKTAPKPKADKVEKKKKKIKKSAVAEEEDPSAQPDLPEVTKERFSEVSESIKQAFIKKDNSEPQGFSLLAAFGRKDQDSEEESDEETTDKPFTSVLDPLTLESRFKVTESDSEHERDQEEAMSEDEETSEQPKSIFEDPAPVFVQPSTFFFVEDDPRLKEGEKFHRTEDMETIREKWLKQRPALVESYRNKHKKFKRMMKSKQSKNFHSKQSKNFHSRKQKPR